METIALDFRAFAFIITLAAVVNGLGIVRWLSGFAEYLRRRQSLKVKHYWVFTAAAGFHFLLHILLWWTLWSIRSAGALNFVTYLYVLTGPVLLYLGTSLLAPEIDGDTIDLERHYFAVRTTYSTVLVLVWLWSIFAAPILRGVVAPTAPILALFLILAVTQRISDNPKAHSVTAVLNWALLAAFIGLYAMQLGGTAG